MPNKVFSFFIIFFFVTTLFTSSTLASLLDNSNPIYNQNQPLARNPARAAFLRDKNKISLGQVLSTGVTYTSNFLRYSDGTYKGIAAQATNPLTGSYFNAALPLFSEDFYLGIIYVSELDNRRLDLKRDTTISYEEDSDDMHQSISGGGLTFSLALLNRSLFLGLEALQKKSVWSEVYIQSLPASRQLNRYTFESVPYNTYTLGLMLPLGGEYQALSLTQTWSSAQFINYKSTISSGTIDTEENEFNFYPASITGLAYWIKMGSSLELGLSSELTQKGVGSTPGGNEEITNPFSRHTLALENKFSDNFGLRIFGSYIKDKDVRTNYYDRSLYSEKLSLLPVGDTDYDGKNVFNEEKFGLDFEFSYWENVSLLLGVSQKNIIFEGHRGPYGYHYVLNDARLYLGFSIGGIFQPPKKEEPQKKPAEYEELIKETIEEIEEDLIPTTQDVTLSTVEKTGAVVQSALGEELVISSYKIFPGTDVNVILKEGQKSIFKSSVVFSIKNRAYKYPLYQTGLKTWKTVIPFSPLTEAGDYKIKLYKIYEDTTLELVTFNITVKDI
ncbi:MAG: hypothetical protein KKA19_09715 [Candidatus Margulisbacteria bacterium]|nr:hypothetical protein [Candidatus Margulisiibacteriota bacterium]